MSHSSDRRTKEYGIHRNGDISEAIEHHDSEAEAKRREVLVEWLHAIIPGLGLPLKSSNEELRSCLSDGVVFARILNRLKPGSFSERGDCHFSPTSCSDHVKRFLAAMEELKNPKFEISDLEKGSMKPVVDCLLTLRAHFVPHVEDFPTLPISPTKSGSPHGDSPRSYLSALTGDERRNFLLESKFQRSLRSPVMSESAVLAHHAGQRFHEVFQMKQGSYADLPASKISEMMKSNSLDNAPTQSLLSMVNGILEESVERKNGEIPHRVACLLRKVVQEIERRISTQAEHLRTQNNLFKSREEKYQSRIRVLEALATGTSEETEGVTNKLQNVKTEKTKIEEKKKSEEEEVARLIKEKDRVVHEILALKKELETAKEKKELRDEEIQTRAKSSNDEIEEKIKELARVRNAKEDLEKKVNDEVEEKVKELVQVTNAKEDLEKKVKKLEMLLDDSTSKRKELEHLLGDSREKIKELEHLLDDSRSKVKGFEHLSDDSRSKIKELEHCLEDLRGKVKALEANSMSKLEWWSKKEKHYKNFIDSHCGSLQELRYSSNSIKQVIYKARQSYSEDIKHFGAKLKTLTDAAQNYNVVLAENRKMFNEIQDLKGNIRVFCRVRPFFPGQNGKQTIIEHIGDNGELVVANPSKQGKDGHRIFKFNKVFGQTASQVDVYSETQPFIRSVVDGYNACIFAYGQTGSGKTYTMTGPNGASEKDWGVNYRALNDLFRISQQRKSSYTYEIGVQMVEIYNEQVRDLLSSDAAQKKLGIANVSKPNGLAVPDASMQPVTSTSDVLNLMEIGLKNRAVGTTAMNERSSRSHSIVSIHVRGMELKTGSTSRGSLHLVDLAGSERVDRSEVTGDRLREAQHINKSLSALGDVISALALKNSHIPYRNSKLTQVLQSSLGGQAKTLMFVQLNPDANSYSESLSTLKFAERASGVELGAARSSKEGRDVRELMEQVASLKDTISKKDEEIERLQLLKDLKNVYPGVNNEKRVALSTKNETSSPNKSYVGGSPQRSQSDIHEAESQQSSDDLNHRRGKVDGGEFNAEAGTMDNEDVDYDERFDGISESNLSMGTDTDASSEYTNSPFRKVASSSLDKAKTSPRVLRSPKVGHTSSTSGSPRIGHTSTTSGSLLKETIKTTTGIKKAASSSNLQKSNKRWH